ncbi:MAG: hypothetical protein AAGK22_27190 [Acidobacteriota bacterium]
MRLLAGEVAEAAEYRAAAPDAQANARLRGAISVPRRKSGHTRQCYGHIALEPPPRGAQESEGGVVVVSFALCRWFVCRRSVALLLIVLGSLPANAQLASLTADLTPGRASFPLSGPDSFQTIGSRVFFIQLAGRSPGTAWATDGTVRGTVELPVLRPAILGEFAGQAVIGGASGVFLSDGTLEGTRRITARAVSATSPIELEGRLFLSANTPDGSQGVLVLEPGAATAEYVELLAPNSGSGKRPLVVSEGVVFARLSILAGVEELWVTNGRPGGGERVTPAGLHVGNQDPIPVLGGVLFTARDSSQGGIWFSDGTAGGTRSIFSFGEQAGGFLWPAPNGVVVALENDPGRFASTVDFFHIDREGDSTRLSQLPIGPPVPGRIASFKGGFVYTGVNRDGSLSLFANDGDFSTQRELLNLAESQIDVELMVLEDSVLVSTDRGELFSTRGTVASTVSLGARGGTRLARSNAGAFFVRDGALWETEGTPESTRQRSTAVIPSGVPALLRGFAAALGERVVFIGDDEAHGLEPWVVAGTPGSSRLLADLQREGAGSALGRVAGQGSTAFVLQHNAPSGGDTRLLAQDSSGVRVIVDRRSSSCNERLALLAVAGERALLECFVDFDSQLWAANAQGELELLVERTFGSLPQELFFPLLSVLSARSFPLPAADRVAFFFDGEVWSTDGTAAGTAPLGSIPSSATPLFARDPFREDSPLLQRGDRVYIWLEDGLDYVLQRLVLRNGSTTDLARVDQGLGRPWVRTVIETATHAYFSLGSQLWRAGGGSIEPVDLPQDVFPIGDSEFVSVGQSLLLLAGLGTPSGLDYVLLGIEGLASEQLLDLGSLERSEFTALSVQPVQDSAVVSLFRGVGSELYSTDGSVAGTKKLADTFETSPRAVGKVAGRSGFEEEVFLPLADHATGTELWATDGTLEGTRLVHDLWPGSQSSRPSFVTRLDDRLLFVADDGLHGSELFTLPLGPPECVPDASSLCLDDGRFRAQIRWEDFEGGSGRGQVVELTEDTGAFWFFDPNNLEVVTKILDGRQINGRYWVFAGALTDVPYALTVADATTGESRRYLNPSGNFGSFGDTGALGALPALGTSGEAVRWVARSIEAASSSNAVENTASCVAAEDRLCLGSDRFSVEVSWATRQGTSGTGQAVPLTEDTGYFWFFDSENVELMLKILDARAVNGRFWVFFGSLSDVQFEVTVTDSQSGMVRTYRNELGTFASVGDTAAF